MCSSAIGTLIVWATTSVGGLVFEGLLDIKPVLLLSLFLFPSTHAQGPDAPPLARKEGRCVRGCRGIPDSLCFRGDHAADLYRVRAINVESVALAVL